MIERINYSEFWALSACEQRWVYAYQRHQEEQGAKRGLKLGTLLHLGLDLWNRGELTEARLPTAWADDINAGGKPGEVLEYSLAMFDEDVVGDALWLLGRYIEHYGPQPPESWTYIDSERWLSAPLYEGSTELVGRTDGVILIRGDDDVPDGLWLLERKSYGSKGRLDYIHVDPQPVIYKRLVEHVYGQELTGVIYDGIYTYHWKRDPHPPADSFDRRHIDIATAGVARAEQYMTAALGRRNFLMKYPELALPNVGMTCNMCGFKAQCWDELRGVEPVDIEEDDPSAEPV